MIYYEITISLFERYVNLPKTVAKICCFIMSQTLVKMDHKTKW